MEFSLSFFSSTGAETQDDKYALLRQGAEFADRQKFAAVWTPERHFHPFGGIFPNPSVIGGLLAGITDHVRIRAGSVVVPLHHPIRVAEEWSVVDNLSGGRVDVAFATGWHPDDFILAPNRYEDRIEKTFHAIETVRRLWRGEAFSGSNGAGDAIAVKIHPRPCQAELPVWLTCTGTPERFIDGGRRGYHILTALIFITKDTLAERIASYRDARAQAGLDPATGRVSLMLHTFVGDTVDEVREIVREPMKQYLRSSVDLWSKDDPRLAKLTSRADALEFAFERYFANNGLFGPVDECVQRARDLEAIGVDEIASLIDFGVDPTKIESSLSKLGLVKDHFE